MNLFLLSLIDCSEIGTDSFYSIFAIWNLKK